MDLRGQKNLTRGLRNNNPGNLVRTNIPWKGKVPHNQNSDDKFEQFISMEYGVRAMMTDITSDYSKGSNTLTKLISEYAPLSDGNNTPLYIKTVARDTGLPENGPFKMDLNTLKKIVRSKIDIENRPQGAKVSNSVIDTAAKMLSSSTLLRLKNSSGNEFFSIVPILIILGGFLILSK